MFYSPFKLPSGRRCLGDCPAIIKSPGRYERVIKLIDKLNSLYPFLKKNETAEQFIKQYDFGQTVQYYRLRFRQPQDRPTMWWNDNHRFATREKFGLHVAFRSFFAYFGVDFAEPTNTRKRKSK